MSKMGRPTVDTAPVTVRLHRDLLDALDALRKKQDDLPTRPEMIRRVLSSALLPKQ